MRWFGRDKRSRRVRRDSEGYVVKTLTAEEREEMVQRALQDSDAEDGYQDDSEVEQYID
jgi:hypothetical protein